MLDYQGVFNNVVSQNFFTLIIFLLLYQYIKTIKKKKLKQFF